MTIDDLTDEGKLEIIKYQSSYHPDPIQLPFELEVEINPVLKAIAEKYKKN